MWHKKRFVFLLGLLCVTFGANAANQSFVLNASGVSITGTNAPNPYIATYSEAITEYLIAAITMIPNSYINRAVDIADPATATPKVLFEINAQQLFLYHTAGVDDVIINIKSNQGAADVGTITLPAGASVAEKLKFDYQVGLLLKVFFQSDIDILTTTTISGGVVTFTSTR